MEFYFSELPRLILTDIYKVLKPKKIRFNGIFYDVHHILCSHIYCELVSYIMYNNNDRTALS